MKRFHVYWNYGSCYDGSHDNGLDSFDTEAEADRCIEHIMRTRGGEDPDIVKIEGTIKKVTKP